MTPVEKRHPFGMPHARSACPICTILLVAIAALGIIGAGAIGGAW